MHRDYQSSILAITNAAGGVVEKRLFDPWGAVTKIQDGAGVNLAKLTFFDRGYTGHEHLQSVGLINMNARLYDPNIHRFLEADNYVQDINNTQNYNRYGYCVNNPLKYNDLDGNNPLLVVIAIAVAVSAFTYTATALLADVPFSVSGLIVNCAIAAGTAVVTFGIGEAFSTTTNLYLKATYSALAHGVFQGTTTAAQGGKFWAGFAAGAISNLAASAIQLGSMGVNSDNTSCVTDFGTVMNKPLPMLAAGAIMGGAGAALAQGNFWQGAVTGLVVSGFNHLMHSINQRQLDKEVDNEFGVEADDEAPITKQTLDRVENLPTLKKWASRAGNPKNLINENRYAPDKKSEALTELNSDNRTSTTTYFGKSFDSYRYLAHNMLHEIGHGIFNFLGYRWDLRQKYGDYTGWAASEFYAYRFANMIGGNSFYYNVDYQIGATYVQGLPYNEVGLIHK